MSAPSDLSRREFLETTGAVGAGLVIGFRLPAGGRFAAAPAAPFAPHAWLRISPDNSVLIVVDRSEMGQGVGTALPMLVAQELDAEWTKVKNDSPPALKSPKDWKILGHRVKRLDTPAKVDGSAQFGIDVKVPGMLVAVVARCPTIGGKVASFDAARAKAVPGVKDVVQISSGVAVVADGYWNAKKGRDALDVKWDDGPNAQVSSASISQLLTQTAQKPGAQARHDGDPDGALGGSANKVEAAYELPFLAHATMEPMNCTAHVRADGVDIWAPTQFQTGAQGMGAKIGGVPPEKVQVHTTYLGGGFGRRFEVGFIQEALETSKAVGAAVKGVWSREDDTQHDQYRPVSYHTFHAGLDSR